jgi:RNA polymerase I-specific transcription initiation factor RRN3
MLSFLPPVSKLQMSRTAKPQVQHAQKQNMPPPALQLQSIEPRSSSLAGKKRPRESDPDPRSRARRTKSTGDARDSAAFQRGLIAVFVPNALRQSLVGDITHYTDLLSHFLPTPSIPRPPLAPLLPLLRAISAHVNLLDQNVHGGLVSAIVSLDWAIGDEKFVRTYVGWAGVLVSAHPGWGREVVGMAVRGLAWSQWILRPHFLNADISS